MKTKKKVALLPLLSVLRNRAKQDERARYTEQMDTGGDDGKRKLNTLMQTYPVSCCCCSCFDE